MEEQSSSYPIVKKFQFYLAGLNKIFQDYNLIDNMTVFDNIALSLRINGIKDSEEIKKRVDYCLDKVGMYRYRNRLASMLSGGERQRVGIARALANQPDILLMDEPFGAVDEITRRQLQDELLKIYQQKKITILFVTHDIQEALKLGTKVLIMDQGQIQQFDTPENIIKYPANNFVKKLVSKNEF